MQVLAEKIVNNPGFITPVTAFVWPRVINAVEVELKQEPLLRKEVSFLPDRSPSASTGATSDEESTARRSRRKRLYR